MTEKTLVTAGEKAEEVCIGAQRHRGRLLQSGAYAEGGTAQGAWHMTPGSAGAKAARPKWPPSSVWEKPF
ncbi:hypothetical protein JCM10599A_45550 [Paraburkholderia kururiensis]